MGIIMTIVNEKTLFFSSFIPLEMIADYIKNLITLHNGFWTQTPALPGTCARGKCAPGASVNADFR